MPGAEPITRIPFGGFDPRAVKGELIARTEAAVASALEQTKPAAAVTPAEESSSAIPPAYRNLVLPLPDPEGASQPAPSPAPPGGAQAPGVSQGEDAGAPRPGVSSAPAARAIALDASGSGAPPTSGKPADSPSGASPAVNQQAAALEGEPAAAAKSLPSEANSPTPQRPGAPEATAGGEAPGAALAPEPPPSAFFMTKATASTGAQATLGGAPGKAPPGAALAQNGATPLIVQDAGEEPALLTTARQQGRPAALPGQRPTPVLASTFYQASEAPPADLPKLDGRTLAPESVVSEIKQAFRDHAAAMDKPVAAVIDDAKVIESGKLPSANSPDAEYSVRSSALARDGAGDAVTLDLYLAKTGPGQWEAAIYDRASAGPMGAFPYSAPPESVHSFSPDPISGEFLMSGVVTMFMPKPLRPTGAVAPGELARLAIAAAATLLAAAATATGNEALAIAAWIGASAALLYLLRRR